MALEFSAEPEEAVFIHRPFAAPPTLFRVPREDDADAGGLAHCPQCSRVVSRTAACCPRCDTPLRTPQTSTAHFMLQPYRFPALSGRTPGVVGEARTFCLVNIVVAAVPTWFAALGTILCLVGGGGGIAGCALVTLAGIAWMLTNILVYRGLEQGVRAAWYGHLIQALLLASGAAAALYFSGGFAALTGIVPAAGIWSLAILSRWFRRDTRAWFSFPARQPRMLPLPPQDRLWSLAQERGEGSKALS